MVRLKQECQALQELLDYGKQRNFFGRTYFSEKGLTELAKVVAASRANLFNAVHKKYPELKNKNIKVLDTQTEIIEPEKKPRTVQRVRGWNENGASDNGSDYIGAWCPHFINKKKN